VARAYLKGLPELKRKLIRLKEETAPAVRPAMEAAAAEIVRSMKSLVPTDSGDLQNSIGWTWGDAPRGSFSVSAKIGSNKITIFAGDDKAFYARWVEFGTAPHINGGRVPGSQNPGTSAQPFFFPAYRANRKQVKTMIGKAIRDAVRKAVR
jgi:HK97 gp10 family phage protein